MTEQAGKETVARAAEDAIRAYLNEAELNGCFVVERKLPQTPRSGRGRKATDARIMGV